MTDDIDRGAIIRPTNRYCNPEGIDPEESAFDWEILPVEDLENEGIMPCGICYDETGTDRSGGRR